MYVAPFYYGCIDSEPYLIHGLDIWILVSVHKQRVGNASSFLVIFSKRDNLLKVSVKKINCITLLLTQWQGTIDRTFVLPSGKTSLTSRKSSAWFDTDTSSSVGEPHRIRRDHYMLFCWMCLYTPYPTIKTRMIVYSLSLQPRVAPPLVVLYNTFGGHGYDLAIKRWILGGFDFLERNAPENFRNTIVQKAMGCLPSPWFDYLVWCRRSTR